MRLRDVRSGLATLVNTATSFDCKDYFPGEFYSGLSYVGLPERVDLTAGRTADDTIELRIPVTFVAALSDPQSAQYAIDAVMSGDVDDALDTYSPTSWKSARVVEFIAPTPTEGGKYLVVSLVLSIRAQL